MRVVLDSSVIVSALRSKLGASHAILRYAIAGRLTPLATPALFFEYEDVLKRDKHLAAAGLDLAKVDQALKGLAALIEPVEVRYSWRPQLPDPGDEMVLDAAVNGRADALVTHNGRHFFAAALLFDLPICSPADLLRRLERE